MSIENMTSVSYLMFGISGVFAVAAVILFFVLDIRKCWRMVSGRNPVRRERRQKDHAAAQGQAAKTPKTEPLKHICIEKGSTERLGDSEMLAWSGDTLPRADKSGMDDEAAEETMLLRSHTDSGRTELLDTEVLEMIQDIVFVQGATETE